MGNFEEGGLFCQVFDGVASVSQNTFLSVEEGNFTLRGSSIFKTCV